MLKKLAQIDRKCIYGVVTLCIIIPLLKEISLPIRISPPVSSAYNFIEKLSPNSVVLISVDYDPAAEPELQPMLEAILKHAFMKNLKVIVMTLWPLGSPLAEEALQNVVPKYNKRYGIDYVNLGYAPGASSVMLTMGKNIREAYPKDARGTELDSLPMMVGVKNYEDISLLVGIEAGFTGDFWIRLIGAQYKQKIIIGCTGVIAPDMYPYLQAGQIEGLIGALKGAAEYETLIKQRGKAIKGMTAQSVAHLVLILFIIIGNIGFFFLRKGEK
jgi:hypothetical protein